MSGVLKIKSSTLTQSLSTLNHPNPPRERETKKERERERERERETDRQTDRQTDRERINKRCRSRSQPTWLLSKVPD